MLILRVVLTCRSAGDAQRDSWMDAARLLHGEMVAFSKCDHVLVHMAMWHHRLLPRSGRLFRQKVFAAAPSCSSGS